MTLAISIAALAVSMVALVIASYFSHRGLREARRANSLPTLVDLLREYRSPRMVRARATLMNELDPDAPPCAFYELPDELREAATLLTHYLDHLGVLLHGDLVDPSILAASLGVSAERTWEELAGCIEVERERREHRIYLNYFEHLVATLREYDPEMRYRGLRQLPVGPGE